ncbi:hypothetical protein HDA32_003590 [Spinactinospora alkalitolerans]|uniref:Uncharacterized protein n=1 Tax=Spinactinospora alkalitolerans TaxID=687207 RepID=A0A852U3E3_9ACTN|nr:hypothetical protein [Spinactinospora alkalitolerans]NYE48470.1 hypothetical protein [Spinactinospora alkalitolerans]
MPEVLLLGEIDGGGDGSSVGVGRVVGSVGLLQEVGAYGVETGKAEVVGFQCIDPGEGDVVSSTMAWATMRFRVMVGFWWPVTSSRSR